MNKPLHKLYFAMCLYFICFLTWNFDYTKNSTIMNILDFIIANPTLVVGIGTILATLAYTLITYRTLGEMRKQRESMYMPDIVIREKKFYLVNNVNGSYEPVGFLSKYPKNWGNEMLYNFEFHLSENGQVLTLELSNIGLATAKKVIVDFDFYLKELIAKLNYIISEEDEYILKKENNETILCKGDKIIFEEVSLKSYKSIDYILPVNFSDTPTSIFIRGILPYLLFEILKRKPDTSLDISRVNISYFDINNKRHDKFYNLSIKCLSVDYQDTTYKWISNIID